MTALFNILKTMLKIDKMTSIQSWIYLMQKYSLKKMQKDIDFTPLINNFLVELLKYQSLEETLDLISKLKNENKSIIESKFLNIFSKSSGIYQYFSRIIEQKETNQELTSLQFIANNYLIDSPLIFELTTFLKNIILIHLKTKNIDIDLFLKISNLSITNKDKALLKTLFIDYI